MPDGNTAHPQPGAAGPSPEALAVARELAAGLSAEYHLTVTVPLLQPARGDVLFVRIGAVTHHVQLPPDGAAEAGAGLADAVRSQLSGLVFEALFQQAEWTAPLPAAAPLERGRCTACGVLAVEEGRCVFCGRATAARLLAELPMAAVTGMDAAAQIELLGVGPPSRHPALRAGALGVGGTFLWLLLVVPDLLPFMVGQLVRWMRTGMLVPLMLSPLVIVPLVGWLLLRQRLSRLR